LRQVAFLNSFGHDSSSGGDNQLHLGDVCCKSSTQSAEHDDLLYMNVLLDRTPLSRHPAVMPF
jgi:hypothetical protein